MDSKEELSQIIDSHIHVDYKRDVLMFKPSYRHLLYLIAKDKRTLALEHYIEVLKLHRSDKEKYKDLTDVIRLFHELKSKGYIKPTKFQDGNVITLRGHVYRLWTHPSMTFWGVVLAVVAIIVALLTIR